MSGKKKKVTVTPIPETGILAITPTKKDVKIATADLFINDTKAKDADDMAYMLFQSIGGQELSTIVRSDNVNSSIGSVEGVAYSPVSDLATISTLYNPKTIVALQGTDVEYFNDFPIDINYHTPKYGKGPNGANIYVDDKTGDLYIDTINLTEVQSVEIEIFTIEEVIDDTIYVEAL
jgi:hypothetical protein